MAESNGTVAVRDPDALVKEIERTRESLARTIDALTERASPANMARRAVERAREQAQRPQVRMAGGVVAAAVALGAVAYLLRRRHR
ncbi:MAG TPA: DUF3618 domain-containing protein [Streptosporangiaceae bacterium]|nr:DUF3618 domain-containing protein [Streptosporangiaceae bacterium]